MSRYLFDTDLGFEVRDETGIELSSIAEAETEAFRRAAIFARDPGNLKRVGTICVIVRNQRDQVVLTVRLVCTAERGEA